jgi:hypothetical protein
MPHSLAVPRRQAPDNVLAPQLTLVGEVPTKAVAGQLWMLPIVAASIDAVMSRKEAAIRLGINEGTLSRQLSGEDGKCMNFARFGDLGDAVAIELCHRLRAHFGLDDPQERVTHAMNLVAQGMALLVAEAKR